MATDPIVQSLSTSTPTKIALGAGEANDGISVRKDLNILLVEDDDADAYLIERALIANPRIAGIVRARDGVEALELVDARRMRPDLAIVDLHMPRKNGIALLAELEARVTAEFPSVVLTSSKSPKDARMSMERGATQVITKPSSLTQLTSALDRVVAAL